MGAKRKIRLLPRNQHLGVTNPGCSRQKIRGLVPSSYRLQWLDGPADERYGRTDEPTLVTAKVVNATLKQGDKSGPRKNIG